MKNGYMGSQERSTSLDEIFGLDRLLLLDCEYTCWEDSLPTQWADPRRPAELIEIALVEYDVPDGRVGRSFHALVRPSMNPVLSAYCKGLTRICQADVEHASFLPEVLIRLEAWRSRSDRCNAPICAWGTGDLRVIAQDAGRHGCPSPLEGVREISLPDLYRAAVSRQAFGDGERDTIRQNLGLQQCEGRHRALADALDLVGFLAHLRSMAKAG